LVLGATLWTSSQVTHKESSVLQAKRLLVDRLGLTDLALFTEARYTRHPSQTDWHSAFQDHPAAFDHFPTGSLIAPPSTLTQNYVAGKTTSSD
jgi:hypothetical protein